jgi:hypothetical protein
VGILDHAIADAMKIQEAREVDEEVARSLGFLNLERTLLATRKR